MLIAIFEFGLSPLILMIAPMVGSFQIIRDLSLSIAIVPAIGLSNIRFAIELGLTRLFAPMVI